MSLSGRREKGKKKSKAVCHKRRTSAVAQWEPNGGRKTWPHAIMLQSLNGGMYYEWTDRPTDAMTALASRVLVFKPVSIMPRKLEKEKKQSTLKKDGDLRFSDA